MKLSAGGRYRYIIRSENAWEHKGSDCKKGWMGERVNHGMYFSDLTPEKQWVMRILISSLDMV